jgi:predicted ATPase/class 3 adenylate cyclase
LDCSSCGSSNPEGKRFCGDCGAPLVRVCPACASANPPGNKFCADCGQPLVVAGAPGRTGPALPVEPPPLASALGEGEGLLPVQVERRQLTILFADLVGSTELSTFLDPEDFRDVLKAYQACAAETIHAHGGIINRYLGDGILAYFGYPKANEDDAEQAVRAGLGLLEAIARLRPMHPVKLQVRIGVATGMVVVGDVIGEGGAQENAVFGQTPNLASRLQAIAESGTMVICATTRRLLGGLFEYRERLPVDLKGFAQPVPTFEILRTSAIESRLEARHEHGFSPFLGRSEQLELLLRRWRDAIANEGRVVILTGEPGIGKSRITHELHQCLKGTAHLSVRYFCSLHHANSALFPIISQLERAAKFERADSAAAKLAKLEALLEVPSTDDPQAVAILANLLGLPAEGLPPLPDWNPETRKKKTFEVLLDQLERVSMRAPVLMIFEDVHWIDPTSLDLLSLMVERAPMLRLLILITGRPEFAPPWPEHAHVSTMVLTRLARTEGQVLVERITAGKPLPEGVLNQILARTDGVPLFIEELTKAVLESGMLSEQDGRYVVERSLTLAIPETLQASLMARLDRLSPVREIAQIGAAVGREFPYELLSAVAKLPKTQLDAALERLVQSELVYRRGQIPAAVYAFKHALVRDAAYAGLLKSRRAELHGAIAQVIRERFPEVRRSQPEILAHHLSEAGQRNDAAVAWLEAGRIAAQRSANLEAIAHLRRGLDAVAALAEGLERDRLELDLLYALGPCLIATQGPASTTAVATFERAREVCNRLGDPPESLQVMFWLATGSVIRGELAKADEAVVTLLRLAEARDERDRPALLNALRGRGMILLFMGRPAEARVMTERFLETFEASTEQDQLAARAAGQDARAAGLALLSWELWVLGQPDTAAAHAAAAVERAEAVDHPHSRAYATYYAAVLHALRGETAIAEDFAARCRSLAETHGFGQWLGLSRAVLGICAAQAEPSSASLRLAEVGEALSAYRLAGYQLGITALYVLLCPALLVAGQAEAALEHLDESLTIARDKSEQIFLAELLRQKARVLRATRGPTNTAEPEALLLEALDAARRQQARMLELRAARDLASLWSAAGRRREAKALLGEAYQAFDEGHETADLSQARAWLEELDPHPA